MRPSWLWHKLWNYGWQPLKRGSFLQCHPSLWASVPVVSQVGCMIGAPGIQKPLTRLTWTDIATYCFHCWALVPACIIGIQDGSHHFILMRKQETHSHRKFQLSPNISSKDGITRWLKYATIFCANSHHFIYNPRYHFLLVFTVLPPNMVESADDSGLGRPIP